MYTKLYPTNEYFKEHFKVVLSLKTLKEVFDKLIKAILQY